jgi:pyruvate ferredoxin oxidoreductase alpha subunit
MSILEAPIDGTGSDARGCERVNSPDAAVAAAVARCHPTTVGPAGITGCDVIAAAIDACSTGHTVYAATDPEGLLRMAPSLFRAAHLGLPIVLTVRHANGRRDHAHAMALRDCGWVQLYPSDDQDAVDTHIQAFWLAERLSVPVMVCTDNFEAADSVAALLVPSASEIDAFLGPRNSQARLDPLRASDPLSLYMERCYASHAKHSLAAEAIRQVAAEFRAHFGRSSGGPLTTHKAYAAELAVLGLGATFEAITAAVDDLRPGWASIGGVGLRSFRPFPTQDVVAALMHCRRVVIVERAIAVGIGGIVSTDVRSALAHRPIETHTVIAGLGDRAISPQSLERVVNQAANGTLKELSFLDVDPESNPNVQRRPGWY